MNREDIIRFARESSDKSPDTIPEEDDGLVLLYLDELERFASLVADAEAKRIYEEGMVTVGHMREQILAEREACAKVCDEAAESMTQMAQWGAQTCGKLIKARGQE
jgi:hypothetical protein